MGTRFYDPGMGRFSTRDVLFGDPLAPMSLNQFVYGYQNPVRYNDPTGMVPADSTGGSCVTRKCTTKTKELEANPIDVQESESFHPTQPRVVNSMQAETTFTPPKPAPPKAVGLSPLQRVWVTHVGSSLQRWDIDFAAVGAEELPGRPGGLITLGGIGVNATDLRGEVTQRQGKHAYADVSFNLDNTADHMLFYGALCGTQGCHSLGKAMEGTCHCPRSVRFRQHVDLPLAQDLTVGLMAMPTPGALGPGQLKAMDTFTFRMSRVMGPYRCTGKRGQGCG